MPQFEFVATSNESIQILKSFFEAVDCFVVADMNRPKPDSRIYSSSDPSVSEFLIGGIKVYLRPTRLGSPKIYWKEITEGKAKGSYYIVRDLSAPIVECIVPFQSTQDDVQRFGWGTLFLPRRFQQGKFVGPRCEIDSTYETPPEMTEFFYELENHFRDHMVRRKTERVWLGLEANERIESGRGQFLWRGEWIPPH